MRLDQILVSKNLCESRQEAQEMIKAGNVLVNGEVITKQTRMFALEDKFEVLSRRKYVGRGGDKLEGALVHIYGNLEVAQQKITGKTALDIGSSTGGFTDCLLSLGARSVTAVDVGTSQLHAKLHANPKVTSHESTDIRNFTTVQTYDFIVADLSFISLESVLTKIISFGKKGSIFILLIKPQFEVGKGNTHKGVVKDIELTNHILNKYTELAKEFGLHEITITKCVIVGGNGNQEYFLYGIL